MGAWSCGPVPGGPSGRNRPVVSPLCRAALACLPGACIMLPRLLPFRKYRSGLAALPCLCACGVARDGPERPRGQHPDPCSPVSSSNVPLRAVDHMAVIVLHLQRNHHRGACGTQKAVLSYLLHLRAISTEYHADNLRFHESFMPSAPEKSSCPAGLAGWWSENRVCRVAAAHHGPGGAVPQPCPVPPAPWGDRPVRIMAVAGRVAAT